MGPVSVEVVFFWRVHFDLAMGYIVILLTYWIYFS